jgi:hypothetical protein
MTILRTPTQGIAIKKPLGIDLPPQAVVNLSVV